MTSDDAAAVAFERDWTPWHEAHVRRRSRPQGFFAITGAPADLDPQRFDGVPGAWISDANGVTVELRNGEELRRDARVLSGRYSFGDFSEGMTVDADVSENVVEITTRNGRPPSSASPRPRDSSSLPRDSRTHRRSPGG